ncbi:hypothetical protein ACFKHW_12920 [Bradyrhizobium lupini]|uniref:hypothetical protein n=1 Tax=Rhizobium lupini TaxID=136996 RepID=UPI00367130BC
MVKKKQIQPGGRPTRRQGERLSKNRTFRVRDQLDGQLVQAASNSGRSVSEEIEYRLERSFGEDAAYAGGVIKDMAMRMAVAFQTAGKANAAANGHPEWTSAEWILDTGCYRAAAFAVLDTLLRAYPGNDLSEILMVVDGIPLMVHSLKSDVAFRFVNAKRTQEEKT